MTCPPFPWGAVAVAFALGLLSTVPLLSFLRWLVLQIEKIGRW